MNSILEVSNVTKTFKETKALDEITFTLEEGKIYGLLGRNGAGKTTLLNLVTSKFGTTSGKIFYKGQNVWENAKAQSQICYMTEKNMFPKDFRVKQLFSVAADFHEGFDSAYAAKLTEVFGLDVNKRFKALSKGYESICKMIIALASNCPLVLMDEPVLGLDAAVRDEFYKIFLENFSKKPRTFIISTHLIEEVSGIIEEAIIINKGRLLLKKPVEELLEMSYCVAGKAENVDSYTQGRKIIHQEMVGNFKTTTVFEPSTQKDFEKAGGLGVDIVPVQLQKLFVHITGEQ